MLGDAIRDLMDPRLRGGLGRFTGMKGGMSRELEYRRVRQGYTPGISVTIVTILS